MPKREEYTLEDLDKDVLEALSAQPEENKVGLERPNALEVLRTQAKLEASKTKR